MPAQTSVFYFPLDASQEEEEPIEISLKEEGGKLVADISGLPADMQDALSKRGVRDVLHRGSLFPQDGPLFLEALLREASAYRRFRARADRQ